MADLKTSFEIFTEKRNKALNKHNTFKENFENKRKYFKSELECAGEIVEKMKQKYDWCGTIP